LTNCCKQVIGTEVCLSVCPTHAGTVKILQKIVENIIESPKFGHCYRKLRSLTSNLDIGFTTGSGITLQWHMRTENFAKMAENVLISLKYQHFYRKLGSVNPNLMSDLSLKVQIQRNRN